MDPAPDRRDSRAPSGAFCAEHPQRAAQFTCPRCGSYACVVCWHPSVERCQQCLKRAPTEAAPPIPWERADLSWPARLLATLAGALRPIRSAPAFARDDVGTALRFMLLTWLPLSLLAGVIPHTRTLMFGASFSVQLIGRPSTAEIALDVARAMGAQLALSAVEFGCLLLPFVSLVRAYAPERRQAALRVMLYRTWLLPAALFALYLAAWALPSPPSSAAAEPPPLGIVLNLLEFGLRTIVPVLLFMAMGATARLACGLGPWLSMIVVIVPVLLLLVVNPLVHVAVLRALPTVPPLGIVK